MLTLSGPGTSIPWHKPQGLAPGTGTPSRQKGGLPLPSGPTHMFQLLFTWNPSPLQSSRSSLATTTKIRTRGRSVHACATDCTATESTWGPLSPPTTPGVGQLGVTLLRHPFSGLVDSAGELLHTP